jgi:hypothetical protein
VASNTSSELTFFVAPPNELAAGWTWELGAIPWRLKSGGVYPEFVEKARVERLLWLHDREEAGSAVTIRLSPARANGLDAEATANLADDTEIVLAAGRLDVRARGFALSVEGQGTCHLGQVVMDTEGTAKHG